MSLKHIQQTKAQNLFKPADIIVYAAVALCIVLLFVFFPKSKLPLEYVEVVFETPESDLVLIFTYDFRTDKWRICDDRWEDKITVEEHEWDEVIGGETVHKSGYLVQIVYTGGEPRHGFYNIIRIDKSGVVIVLEADCSAHKDCVLKFPPITRNNMGITCIPHHLFIDGYGTEPEE